MAADFDHQRGTPKPPQPRVHVRNDAACSLPDGWTKVVASRDGFVLAGWTDDGRFWTYATTERIVRECFDSIEALGEVLPVPDLRKQGSAHQRAVRSRKTPFPTQPVRRQEDPDGR